MALYKDPSEQAIYCPDRGYQKPLLGCLACKKFPCAAMNDERMTVLERSPFVQTEFNGFLTRRKKVLLFHMTDGSYKEAPRGFDVDKPDLGMLEDVEEVLVVGKVLVKQIRLVPRPKEERAQIRTAMSEGLAAQQKPGIEPKKQAMKNQRKRKVA